MTRFPLEGGLEAVADLAEVNTQDGFRRHFGILFPEDAIRTLLTATPDLNGSHSGAHDGPVVWGINHTTTTILSGGEYTDSAIIYRFTRFGDGLIKLTSVAIAG